MTDSSLVRKRVHLLVLGTWLLLLVLIAGHPFSQSLSVAAAIRAGLYSIPLLLPLPGLIKGRRYTHTWATLCVLPYFIVSVTEAVANPAIHRWALAVLAASLLWFFALITFLRIAPVSSSTTDQQL